MAGPERGEREHHRQKSLPRPRRTDAERKRVFLGGVDERTLARRSGPHGPAATGGRQRCAVLCGRGMFGFGRAWGRAVAAHGVYRRDDVGLGEHGAAGGGGDHRFKRRFGQLYVGCSPGHGQLVSAHAKRHVRVAFESVEILVQLPEQPHAIAQTCDRDARRVRCLRQNACSCDSCAAYQPPGSCGSRLRPAHGPMIVEATMAKAKPRDPKRSPSNAPRDGACASAIAAVP